MKTLTRDSVKFENRNLLAGCDAGGANDWVRLCIKVSHVERRHFMQ
jgi:hypothetical protein